MGEPILREWSNLFTKAQPRFPKGCGVKNSPVRTWILYGDISEFGDAAGSKDKRFLFLTTAIHTGSRLPGESVTWRV